MNTSLQEEARSLRAERRYKQLNNTLWLLNIALWMAMITLYVVSFWWDTAVFLPMLGVSLVLGYALFVSVSAMLGLLAALFISREDWNFDKRFNRFFLLILTVLQALGLGAVIMNQLFSLFL